MLEKIQFGKVLGDTEKNEILFHLHMSMSGWKVEVKITVLINQIR